MKLRGRKTGYKFAALVVSYKLYQKAEYCVRYAVYGKEGFVYIELKQNHEHSNEKQSQKRRFEQLRGISSAARGNILRAVHEVGELHAERAESGFAVATARAKTAEPPEHMTEHDARSNERAAFEKVSFHRGLCEYERAQNKTYHARNESAHKG